MRLIVNWIIRIGIVELFLLFFILANLLTFFLYFIDKRRAVNGKWRISENVLIFFTLAGGGIGAVAGAWLARHKTKKFRIVLSIGLIIAAIPVIHIVHGFTLDRTVRFVEIDFHSENWPPQLSGYRIAFMSDMHTITHESMRNIIAELNQRNIDLLLLGGDFSMRDNHYQGTLREIAQAVTTDGIFGVEGNHDDYARLFRAKEAHGITPLDNSGIHIRDGFFLAGVHDLWNREPNTQAAIYGAGAGDFVLLIAHNPDVAMVQPTAGIDLILAGHTHGGQITFFGVPLYLLRGSITDYGMRFGYGFAYSADGVPVFTSSGVGDYYNVPRIFARPEVVIFNITS
jgi:predicted MPP superfamily phosphohydrolase